MKNPMTVYQADGTTKLVPYSAQVLAFEFEGFEIRDPQISECGRFVADPKKYGFKRHETGGGCTALILDLPNGDYLLITDEDGSSIPDLGDSTALLGRYTKDGNPIAVITLGDVPFDSDEE